jgi:hypothetical protein
MLSARIEAEVALRSTTPLSWAVEAINTDDDGGIDVTIFSGPRAHERATEYAAWKYGTYRERATSVDKR